MRGADWVFIYNQVNLTLKWLMAHLKGICFHPKVLDNRELGDLFGRKTCQR